jgi:hypothetical protein
MTPIEVRRLRASRINRFAAPRPEAGRAKAGCWRGPVAAPFRRGCRVIPAKHRFARCRRGAATARGSAVALLSRDGGDPVAVELVHRATPHPYWPGGAVLLHDGSEPRAIGLLAHLDAAVLH